MKFTYCITKYNPKYRNIGGGYEKNEWTEVGDIGKTYNGEVFTEDEYLKMESNYLKTIELVIKNDNFFTITNLEKHSNMIRNKNLSFSEREVEFFNTVYDRKKNSAFETLIAAKLILRNEIWGILKSKNLKIEFGYDYYMYLITKVPLTVVIIKKIESFNLFVEKVGNGSIINDIEN